LSNELDNFDYLIANKKELLVQLRDFLPLHENADLYVESFNQTLKGINSKIFPKKIKERNFILHTLIHGFKPTLILDLGTKNGLSAIVSWYAMHNEGLPPQNTNVITVDIDKNCGKFVHKLNLGVKIRVLDSVSFLSQQTFDESRVLIHSDSKASNDHIISELENAKLNVKGTFLFVHDGKWSNANSQFHTRKSWEINLYEYAKHRIYPGRSISVACYDSVDE
jgi:cephalosporin hydroxylase